jgi:hypothetical protein
VNEELELKAQEIARWIKVEDDMINETSEEQMLERARSFEELTQKIRRNGALARRAAFVRAWEHLTEQQW